MRYLRPHRRSQHLRLTVLTGFAICSCSPIQIRAVRSISIHVCVMIASSCRVGDSPGAEGLFQRLDPGRNIVLPRRRTGSAVGAAYGGALCSAWRRRRRRGSGAGPDSRGGPRQIGSSGPGPGWPGPGKIGSGRAEPRSLGRSRRSLQRQATWPGGARHRLRRVSERASRRLLTGAARADLSGCPCGDLGRRPTG